jgi:ABC-type transport system involved in multi-copper enzyme maturation permease subunit
VLNLNAYGGSRLMIFASIWVGLVHIGLAILGTFVLRRFPTSFAIGFFLGILVVLANQNLMLFGVFRNYSFGNGRKNHAFANMAFTLFAVLSLFTTLLANFRHELVVAAVDVKGIGRRQNARGEEDDNDEYQYQDERH